MILIIESARGIIARSPNCDLRVVPFDSIVLFVRLRVLTPVPTPVPTPVVPTPPPPPDADDRADDRATPQHASQHPGSSTHRAGKRSDRPMGRGGAQNAKVIPGISAHEYPMLTTDVGPTQHAVVVSCMTTVE